MNRRIPFHNTILKCKANRPSVLKRLKYRWRVIDVEKLTGEALQLRVAVMHPSLDADTFARGRIGDSFTVDINADAIVKNGTLDEKAVKQIVEKTADVLRGSENQKLLRAKGATVPSMYLQR